MNIKVVLNLPYSGDVEKALEGIMKGFNFKMIQASGILESQHTTNTCWPSEA